MNELFINTDFIDFTSFESVEEHNEGKLKTKGSLPSNLINSTFGMSRNKKNISKGNQKRHGTSTSRVRNI